MLSLVQYFCTVNSKLAIFTNFLHIVVKEGINTMNTNRKKILGELLRRERVIRRINQETLGNVVGLGKTAISAYERGVASPDIEKLDIMCSFLGIDYIELLREAQRIYNGEEDDSGSSVRKIQQFKSA